jgi:5-methylcytosine-specific restriction endonuclease McrA
MGRWTETELALLRDVSLSLKDVSERTGRPLQTVARHRQLRGIQSIKVNREWTAAELALLQDRSLSLAEVARRVGRGPGACRAKASLLGVGKRAGKIGRAAEFSPEEDALLQELSPSCSYLELGSLLGRSEVSICKRLQRLGIRDSALKRSKDQGKRGPEHWRWVSGASKNSRRWRGENWPEFRRAALERDGYTCQEQGCGFFSPSGEDLNVHHIIPWRLRPVNDLAWLVTLCRSHHMRRPEHMWTEIPEDVALLL